MHPKKAPRQESPVFHMPPDLKNSIYYHIDPDILNLYGGPGVVGALTEVFFNAFQSVKVHDAEVLIDLVNQYHQKLSRYIDAYLRYESAREVAIWSSNCVRRRKQIVSETERKLNLNSKKIDQLFKKQFRRIARILMLRSFAIIWFPLYGALKKDIEDNLRKQIDPQVLGDHLRQMHIRLRQHIVSNTKVFVKLSLVLFTMMCYKTAKQHVRSKRENTGGRRQNSRSSL